MVTKSKTEGYFEQKWRERFHELNQFYRIHNHVNIPVRYKENRSLAAWIVRQRLNKEKLSITQKYALDSIGFIWDPRDELWEKNYTKLKEFYIKHGHCNVPISYKEDPVFGRWVRKQRAVEPELSLERIHRLNQLQFSWKLRDDVWIEHYYKLKMYVENHNYCLPKSNTQPKLYNWVNRQRYKYKKSGLDKNKIDLLSELGVFLD